MVALVAIAYCLTKEHRALRVYLERSCEGPHEQRTMSQEPKEMSQRMVDSALGALALQPANLTYSLSETEKQS